MTSLPAATDVSLETSLGRKVMGYFGAALNQINLHFSFLILETG